jgi:hypothetical protein
MCLVLIAVGVASVDVGVVVASRARAQTAADLAALGALVPAEQPPHAVAAAVAEANGARLSACACGTESAVVTVERTLLLPMLGRAIHIPASARAVVPTEPLFPDPVSPAIPPWANATHGGQAAVTALLASPRLALTPDARADLAGGVVDQRLVRLLVEIVRRHRVAVSVFRTGHSHYVAGTRVVSLHTDGRAVDIYKVDGHLVRPGDQASFRLVEWLASLRGPLRPLEVGSPFPVFEPLPGHFSNGDHLDHIHVGVG